MLDFRPAFMVRYFFKIARWQRAMRVLLASVLVLVPTASTVSILLEIGFRLKPKEIRTNHAFQIYKFHR